MASRKKPIISEDIKYSKDPRIDVNPDSYESRPPSWRFSCADNTHPRWSVKGIYEDIVEDHNDPSGSRITHTFSKSIDSELLEHLKSRETMTWGNIKRQVGGPSSGTNSHFVDAKKISKDAQDILTKDYETYNTDALFSLRMSGKKRIYGLLEDGVFNIIWFDRKHEIYPSSK